MANIYSGSYLTIAATSAQNWHVGCFVLEDEQPGMRREISDQSETGSYRVYVRIRGNYGNPTIDGELYPPALLSRAWALQKRFLSPRVLFFGPLETFYECNTASLCECSTDPST
jgi:hypothetical protein